MQFLHLRNPPWEKQHKETKDSPEKEQQEEGEGSVAVSCGRLESRRVLKRTAPRGPPSPPFCLAAPHRFSHRPPGKRNTQICLAASHAECLGYD
ncbi:hypothetical protein MTO96_022295 [Rhipicephalus appendiculatus]